MSDTEAVKKQREEAQAILRDLLRLMGFEAKVESFDLAENEVLLHIESPDAGRLIGRGAQGLEALQRVVNLMTRRPTEPSVRFVVDIERYLERKRDRLLKMAFDAAKRVRRTGQPVKLPAMTASERRIIHQALKDNTDLLTRSEIVGEENEKRVIVDKADSSPTVSKAPSIN